MEVETRILPDPVRMERMNSAELRESFLIDGLFVPGQVRLVYTFLDRMIVGSAVPTGEPLELVGCRELASEHFTQRREVGLLNLGGPGTVTVDGQAYPLENRDGVYIGRGAESLALASDRPDNPARYYIASLPAHAAYPTTHIKPADTEPLELGHQSGANRRTVHKYIHAEGVRSCQLVMGTGTLAAGSVWNTMPPHTHPRRVEAYLYFDLADGEVVFHYLGQPDETRHLVVRDGQVALSPSWSIHSGCGTTNYSFVWAMGGENQQFDDMDAVGMDKLR